MVIKDFFDKVVYLDTAPLIYFLEDNLNYSAKLSAFFRANDDSKFKIITSTITLMEVMVVPIRHNRTDIADAYKSILSNSNGIDLINVDEFVAEEAARIRAKYNKIKPGDSIHLATAIAFNADYFFTNDRDFDKVTEIKIVKLDDLENPKRQIVLQLITDTVCILDINENLVLREQSINDFLITDKNGLCMEIVHLLDKNWINTEILYEIASYVHLKRPNSNINWKDTFFVVEKENYLNSGIQDIKNPEALPKTFFKKYMSIIEFRRDESNDETDKIIEEIVVLQLKENNLPF